MSFLRVFEALRAAGSVQFTTRKQAVYTCVAMVHRGEPCIVGVVGEPDRPSAVTVYAGHWPNGVNLSGTQVGSVVKGLAAWMAGHP